VKKKKKKKKKKKNKKKNVIPYIYSASRYIIEQGTTALSKLIEVNICNNPFGIPTICEGTRPFQAWLY
jgi:hypothetical protein